MKARAFADLQRDDDASIDKWFKEDAKKGLLQENALKDIGSVTVKVRRIVRGNIYDVVMERKNAQPPSIT